MSKKVIRTGTSIDGYVLMYPHQVIVYGNPGSGKSTFVQETVVNLSKFGTKVIVVDTESGWVSPLYYGIYKGDLTQGDEAEISPFFRFIPKDPSNIFISTFDGSELQFKQKEFRQQLQARWVEELTEFMKDENKKFFMVSLKTYEAVLSFTNVVHYVINEVVDSLPPSGVSVAYVIDSVSRLKTIEEFEVFSEGDIKKEAGMIAARFTAAVTNFGLDIVKMGGMVFYVVQYRDEIRNMYEKKTSIVHGHLTGGWEFQHNVNTVLEFISTGSTWKNYNGFSEVFIRVAKHRGPFRKKEFKTVLTPFGWSIYADLVYRGEEKPPRGESNFVKKIIEEYSFPEVKESLMERISWEDDRMALER